MSKPAHSYIDYAAVKSATNIQMVLEHYGLMASLRPSGADALRGCCPIHKGTDDSQFSVSLSKNIWRCFSECNQGGNHLDLVARMEDCTLHAAAWKLNEWFQLGHGKSPKAREIKSKGDAKSNESPRSESGPPTVTPPSMEPSPANSPPKAAKAPDIPMEETGNNKALAFTLQGIDPAHPYPAERGLTPETIAEFGLGYCPKGIMAGRIVIPIHSATGELVAYAGRWPGDPPDGKEKYRLPAGFKKSVELFNAHRAFRESGSQPLVIVEGYFDAMHLWQCGLRRVVALMGCSLSNRQEEMLAGALTPQSRVILMLDNDEAGMTAAPEIARRISAICYVRTFRFTDQDQQPDSLSMDQIEALREP